MTNTVSGTGPGMRLTVIVWVCLLAIVGIEVALSYAGLSSGELLTVLLLLASLEVALAAYFLMRLKWERRLLLWGMVSYLAFALLMLTHIWTDAARVISMRW